MNTQNRSIVRHILISYATTFMIIKLADSLTMIVDGMVISRGLGAAALAAAGLADPSYKMISLFSGVLSMGLQALCAQAMSVGDRKKASGLFSAGLISAAAVSVLLTVLGLCFTGSLCELFGAGRDQVLYENLRNYLKGWFTGIPGYVIFFVLSPIVTLDGNKRNVTAATFIQSGVNVAGDILSVFVLNTGIYGVGFSTGLSYNISAVILLLNFVRKRSAFKPFGSFPDFALLPNIVRIGLPRITEQICRIAAPLVINRTVMAVGGGAAMSAMSVKAGIFGFCVIIGNGIADSVGLLTQLLYNEKDAEGLRKAIKSALKLLFTVGSVFSALLFMLASPISALYFTPGTEEWTLAVQAVRCLALSLLFNGCNLIMIQYLQGTRKMVRVHLLTSFQRVVSLSVFTVVLGKMFGVNGLFAAIPISEATVLIGYVVLTLLTNRCKGFWNSLLMIPDGFGYNDENSCSFSIRTVEEAVGVSEKLESFCREHGVDKRKGYFSARCMEELATNIVEHGFMMDDRKHNCDIRVMISPDEVVFRIRDDCPYFNIRERFDSLSEDDMEAGIGIRLVFAFAKDVTYINILNTNTLIIRL